MTFRIMRLSGLWRTLLDRALKAEGMSIATMRPLAYLVMMPEGTCQRDLAVAMNTDTSAIVRVLDLLEKTGWVERQSDEHDRRTNHLYLTPAGREKCARFREIASELEAAICKDVPNGQVREAIRVMDQILQSAEAYLTSR
ncbi:MarR family transcriptional regulator [Acetobacter senegalensis]|nr:MarR family transcriptional regulator [Acetobacter senegalensis]MDN7356251.1 MarR family transcriptional regulator [Acetobacter senegalensis]